MPSPVDWSQNETQGFISLGSHSLYLRAAGPVRLQNTPAVVCMAGMGESSGGWIAVLRHISTFARAYVYDRAGLGDSELPENFTSQSKTYTNIAKELRLMLERASVAPPFIIVMHSMAGIPGREFLHLYPNDVAGMVFVDTVTENNYKTRPKELPRVMRSMGEGVDMSFLWTERKPAMTEEELKCALDSADMGTEVPTDETKARREMAARSEVENLISSSDLLADKKQFESIPLGHKPVSVIKGDTPGEFQRSFEKAVEAGKGTEEDRKLVRDYLAVADGIQLMLQFKQLRLSKNSRLVEARESWHNVHWYQPDLIAREVKWCLEEFEKLKHN